MPRLLRALRGAVVITEDTPEEVASQVEALLREAFVRNGVATEDLVSIFFTATDDIHSVFPAQAARERLELADVPLLCARELNVEGALPGVIRTLIHFYTDKERHEVQHVYLGSATSLRPDLDV
ncbi:MAG: chorismate mutase [bacterium]|nr:chorismate mutase [bacterium]MXV89486.1 chorismate mutase [Acidimicrobiia bacterium]MYC45450.1 chorismate mutase [Acidimicrobiia bacterium]MYI18998.1 chorismate mutase [Acidimicrobiia bacterium]